MSNLTIAKIDALSEMIVQIRLGRSPTKDKAERRFRLLANQNEIDPGIIVDHSFELISAIIAEHHVSLEEVGPEIEGTCERVEPPASASKELPAPIPRPEPEAPPAANSGASLTLTTEQINSAKTMGNGTWELNLLGVRIIVNRVKDEGGFAAALTRDGINVTGKSKTFVASVRRAVDAFNQINKENEHA